MDWIGEALSLVFGISTLWQRGKTKKAQAEAKKAKERVAEEKAKAERLEAELDLIRTTAGTKASWEK